MAEIVADRVLETTTTTGTGALTLAGAVAGFRTFGAVCANGDTVYYHAEAVDASGVPTGAWETGLGTWGTGGILTRTTVQASSNAGAAVSFAAGTKRVALSITAVKAVKLSSLSGTNTGDQTITLTGDVTGSGTGSFAATLANTAVAPATYTYSSFTVDAKGRITAASSGTTPLTGPAGSNTQVQFNNSGALGAAANLTFDNTTGAFNVIGAVNGGNVVARFANTGTGTTTVVISLDGTSNGFNVRDSQIRASNTSNATTLEFYTASGSTPIKWLDIAANGTVTARSSTDSTSTATGALVCAGGVGVVGQVTCTALGTGAPVTKTADFTVAANETSIINNKAAANCTATLPNPVTYPGRWLYIKNYQAFTVVSASSNVVPQNGGSAGTAILATVGKWAALQSDGTNWQIMLSN